jgi:2-dehydro-3-deoxyphosphogluconate aldolase/(4S)-4-hydroxy-2-oxoglutarate aldolase
VEFDESTATYDEKGKLKVVYMKDDIAGFAFHIVQK